jgi:hypothetical protein
MLTSEFSSASGGIGTYAREIAVVVTQLGCQCNNGRAEYSPTRTTLAIGAMTQAGRSFWKPCAAETYGLAAIRDGQQARLPLAEIRSSVLSSRPIPT